MLAWSQSHLSSSSFLIFLIFCRHFLLPNLLVLLLFPILCPQENLFIGIFSHNAFIFLLSDVISEYPLLLIYHSTSSVMFSPGTIKKKSTNPNLPIYFLKTYIVDIPYRFLQFFLSSLIIFVHILRSYNSSYLDMTVSWNVPQYTVIGSL